MAHHERQTRHLSRDETVRVITLLEEGRSQRYVANLLGVAQSSVSRVAARYRETGEYSRRPGQGRQRITNDVDDRYLRLTALRTRHCTARMLQSNLFEARGVHISVQTVRDRLREGNINARIPATAPLLTRQHRVARLRFAREHAAWGIDDWRHILFSDESRYNLYASDRRIPVYRRPGERYLQCNFRPSVPYGGGSIMVWGGISFGGRTELVPLPGAPLTAHRYIVDILQEHVIPYGPFVGDNFVFMQDNARPHTARIVRDYFQEVGMHILDWPARSPDMNPIEHVWSHLGWELQSRRRPFAHLNQLEIALLEEWDRMSQDYVNSLIDSMPRRLEAVIEARGGHTRY